MASSTNYTIDGMTAKGTVASGTTSGAYTISMEAVREFEVVTNQYDVTYGRSGGGTVSAVTKSGTNTFTGSAFVFGRADWLSSPYDIRGNKTNSEYSTYQYGFSLGGPITIWCGITSRILARFTSRISGLPLMRHVIM